MSAPEPHTEPDTTEPPGGQLVHEPAVPGSTRTARVTDWVGHRLPEISAVGLPLWPAFAVSPWFAAVSVVAAAWWGAAERRVKHKTQDGGDAS